MLSQAEKSCGSKLVDQLLKEKKKRKKEIWISR
jgi:hypothetical protein